MNQIKVYNKDLEALGVTSRAFDISKTEELMRGYTLDFSITNLDKIYPYVTDTAVFEYGGQKFDIVGIDGNSGTNNITQVTTEHISYRLAEYTLPPNYAFVGSISEIANDILTQAKTVDEVSASTVFSIGTCADKDNLSFSMGESQNVTARQALICMSELGVEIEFDNFTVNIPEKRGADNGMTFDYGRNLSDTHRTWQKGNGWSYDISIADLQKIPDHSGDTFALGDYVTVNDKLLGTSKKDRIISYTECDDPSQNKITIGVFVKDSADIAVETDNYAKSSIQEGTKYSNVTITHDDGFKAESADGKLRVVQNADDCFAVQSKQTDGTWKTINSLEDWGLLINRLTTQDAKDKFYVEVGNIGGSDYGIKLVCVTNGNENTILKIGQINGTYSPVFKSSYPIVFEKTGNSVISVQDSSGNIMQDLSTKGYTGTIIHEGLTIDVEYGIITGVSG